MFEGKIVESGGKDDGILKSVEAYDYHENRWINLPNMIYGRYEHGMASMGNKMFVIGGIYDLISEVFDSVSRKFTIIKARIEFDSGFDCNDRNRNIGMCLRNNIVQPVSIGNKVIVLPRFGTNKYLTYYVLTNQWKLEENDFFGTNPVFSCSKVPIV